MLAACQVKTSLVMISYLNCGASTCLPARRFSKDLGTVDDLLPVTVFDALQVSCTGTAVGLFFSRRSATVIFPRVCVAV